MPGSLSCAGKLAGGFCLKDKCMESAVKVCAQSEDATELSEQEAACTTTD